MSASPQIATRHFGRAAVSSLSRKGIRIVGLTTIPDMTAALPFASGETGYNVDDNGCGRVWTYQEVRAAL